MSSNKIVSCYNPYKSLFDINPLGHQINKELNLDTISLRESLTVELSLKDRPSDKQLRRCLFQLAWDDQPRQPFWDPENYPIGLITIIITIIIACDIEAYSLLCTHFKGPIPVICQILFDHICMSFQEDDRLIIFNGIDNPLCREILNGAFLSSSELEPRIKNGNLDNGTFLLWFELIKENTELSLEPYFPCTNFTPSPRFRRGNSLHDLWIYDGYLFAPTSNSFSKLSKEKQHGYFLLALLLNVEFQVEGRSEVDNDPSLFFFGELKVINQIWSTEFSFFLDLFQFVFQNCVEFYASSKKKEKRIKYRRVKQKSNSL